MLGCIWFFSVVMVFLKYWWVELSILVCCVVCFLCISVFMFIFNCKCFSCLFCFIKVLLLILFLFCFEWIIMWSFFIVWIYWMIILFVLGKVNWFCLLGLILIDFRWVFMFWIFCFKLGEFGLSFRVICRVCWICCNKILIRFCEIGIWDVVINMFFVLLIMVCCLVILVWCLVFIFVLYCW